MMTKFFRCTGIQVDYFNFVNGSRKARFEYVIFDKVFEMSEYFFSIRFLVIGLLEFEVKVKLEEEM